MTGPEDAPADHTRPDEQDVTEALRYFRGNPSALNVLGDSAMAVYYSAATIVRAALAAGPKSQVSHRKIHGDAPFMRMQDAIETALIEEGHGELSDFNDVIYVAAIAALSPEAGASPAAGPDGGLLAQVDAIRKLRVESWEQDNRDNIARAVERAALFGARPAAEPDRDARLAAIRAAAGAMDEAISEFVDARAAEDGYDVHPMEAAKLAVDALIDAGWSPSASARPAGDATTETRTEYRVIAATSNGDVYHPYTLEPVAQHQAKNYRDRGISARVESRQVTTTRVETPWTEQR